jgi:hypothetical protein
VVLMDREKLQQELDELECERNALVGLRNARVAFFQSIIVQANQEFDKAALPLGRKINTLRTLLEEAPPEDKQPQYREPDPEWCPEDIAHYNELRLRESVSKTRQ